MPAAVGRALCPGSNGGRGGRQLRVGAGSGPLRRAAPCRVSCRVGGGRQRILRRIAPRGGRRFGDVEVVAPGLEPRVRRRGQPGSRRDHGSVHPGVQSRSGHSPGDTRRAPRVAGRRPGVCARRTADPRLARQPLSLGTAVPQPDPVSGARGLGIFVPNNPFTRSYHQAHLDSADGTCETVDWVSGACFLVRRSAFEQVGGFDESYFMYAEDVDLCWRLGRRGWRVLYLPSAEVTHLQGVSTEHHPFRMIAEHHRSLFRFASRSSSGWRRLLLPLVALGIGVRACLACVARVTRG